MKKSVRNALIVTAALSACAAGFGLAFSRLVVDMAVKRDAKIRFSEKLQDKISGGLKTDPGLEEIQRESDAAKQLKTETVTVLSDDGLTLKGHLYTCPNPKRIIVAMHGWRSNWQNDFGSTVQFYNRLGSVMLYADQRGQNDSDGDYIGFGVHERFDCLKWVEFVRARYGDRLPIYLLGVSMGATTVLMASGLELPQSVKGIIADCGFTSPKDIWDHIMSNNLHLNGKLAYPVVNLMCKKVAQFDGEECSTLDALKNNTRPVLFIHGSNDNFVPIKMTFDNYLACTAKKQLLIVPGAGHGMSYITDPNAYKKAVRDFFKLETK